MMASGTAAIDTVGRAVVHARDMMMSCGWWEWQISQQREGQALLPDAVVVIRDGRKRCNFLLLILAAVVRAGEDTRWLDGSLRRN